MSQDKSIIASGFPALLPGTESIDIRPLLAQGLEPFDMVLGRWAALARGGYLLVRAPFFPGPLVAHFSVQGVHALPYQQGPDDLWLLLGPKP